MSRGTGDEEGVPDWVRRIGNGLNARRTAIVGGVLSVGLVFGGVFGWASHVAHREARAYDAYAAALDVLHAPIHADDTPDPDTMPPRRGPRFRTMDERARAGMEKLRQVEQRYPQSLVAPIARLGEASALYQLGRYDEARQVYRSIQGRDLAGLESRAIEGLAFTLESTGDLDGAMAKYRELQTVDDGAYRDAAQYDEARLMNRRGDAAHAKEILHGLIDRLGRIAAGDPTAAASSGLRDESMALLRDIDPLDPAVIAHDRGPGEDHGGSFGRGGAQGIPPEILQRIMRQAQSKQAPGH